MLVSGRVNLNLSLLLGKGKKSTNTIPTLLLGGDLPKCNLHFWGRKNAFSSQKCKLHFWRLPAENVMLHFLNFEVRPDFGLHIPEVKNEIRGVPGLIFHLFYPPPPPNFSKFPRILKTWRMSNLHFSPHPPPPTKCKLHLGRSPPK